MRRLGERTTGLDSVKVRASQFWVLASGSASIELYRRGGPQSVPDQYTVASASFGMGAVKHPCAERLRTALDVLRHWNPRPFDSEGLASAVWACAISARAPASALASSTSHVSPTTRHARPSGVAGGGSSRGDTNAGGRNCRRWHDKHAPPCLCHHGGAHSCRTTYARIRGSHRRRKPAYCGLGRRRGRRTQGLVGHNTLARWGGMCCAPLQRAVCGGVGIFLPSRGRCAPLGLGGRLWSRKGARSLILRPACRRSTRPKYGHGHSSGNERPGHGLLHVEERGALDRVAKLHFVAGLDWGRSRSLSARAGKAKTDEADEDGCEVTRALARPQRFQHRQRPSAASSPVIQPRLSDVRVFCARGAWERDDDESFSEHQGEDEGAVRPCLNKSRFVICIGLTTGSTLPRASGVAIGWRDREETARVPEDSEMKSEPCVRTIVLIFPRRKSMRTYGRT